MLCEACWAPGGSNWERRPGNGSQAFWEAKALVLFPSWSSWLPSDGGLRGEVCERMHLPDGVRQPCFSRMLAVP